MPEPISWTQYLDLESREIHLRDHTNQSNQTQEPEEDLGITPDPKKMTGFSSHLGHFHLVILNFSLDFVIGNNDKEVKAPGMSCSSYNLLSHH